MYKILKIALFGFLLFYIQTSFGMDFGLDKVDESLQGSSSGDLVGVVTNILKYLIGLIYLIAIIFGIMAGFKILTAGGDDAKVKEGKTTMIRVVIGLAVLLLSSVIVNWTIETVDDVSSEENTSE